MKRSEVLKAFEEWGTLHRDSLKDPQEIKDFDENYDFLLKEVENLLNESECESDFAWELLCYWQESVNLLPSVYEEIWTGFIGAYSHIFKAISPSTREETKWEDE